MHDFHHAAQNSAACNTPLDARNTIQKQVDAHLSHHKTTNAVAHAADSHSLHAAITSSFSTGGLMCLRNHMVQPAVHQVIAMVSMANLWKFVREMQPSSAVQAQHLGSNACSWDSNTAHARHVPGTRKMLTRLCPQSGPWIWSSASTTKHVAFSISRSCQCDCGSCWLPTLAEHIISKPRKSKVKYDHCCAHQLDHHRGSQCLAAAGYVYTAQTAFLERNRK